MESVRRNIGFGPDNGDERRITLITQMGADNRGKLLDKSLGVCKKVFDRMIVVDSGATDNSREACLRHGAEVIDFDLSKEHHPEMFAHASRLIPMNEWIFYMDSDECPTPALLCSFKELVERGNAIGIQRYMLPHATHWWSGDGQLVGANLSQIKQFHPGQWLSNHVAHRPRMVKKNNGLTLEYKGSHWVAVNDGNGMFMPLHWNHYKGDKSCCQSSFIHGLSYPEEHCLNANEVTDYQPIQDWKDLKESLNWSMGDIARFSADRYAPTEAMKILSRFNGLNSVATEIWKHAFEFKFDGDEPICNCPLCDYSTIDQFL